MFVVNRVVIHEVIRADRNTPVTLDLSTSLADLATDTDLKILVERINTSFGNTPSLKNSQFDDSADTVFSTRLKEYIADNSDPNFLNFSVGAIQKLKELIEQEPWATGGFYCFADYEDHGRRCVSVILLRRKDSFNFSKSGGTFKAQGGETVNYDKIAMGFRMNVLLYLDPENQRNYIALIASQQEQLSSYFKEWVSVTGIRSREQNTRALVQLVRQLPMPQSEAGQPAYPSSDAFHKAIFDFVEESPQKKVSLTAMAIHFYGEEQERAILDLAEEKVLTIDNEFQRDLKTWKKVISVKAQIPGVKLLIDHEKINAGIVTYTDDQIVIRSRTLVDQIRAQQNG